MVTLFMRICQAVDGLACKFIDLGVCLRSDAPRVIAILPAACVLSFAHPAPGPEQHESRGEMVTTGFILEVARSLETERPHYRREIASALDEVVAWFGEAGYRLSPQELIDKAIVFEDLAQAKKSLAESFGVKHDDIPDTFGGTVGGKTLYLVSRELFRPIWTKLYPDWPWTQVRYHSLIVHELAHRAHESVALSHFGTADAMGPMWFFEGLAVTCAGQFDGGETPLTREEIEKHVAEGKTPPVSYPLYGRLFRSLAHHFDLSELINQACEQGFPASLWNAH